MTIIEDTIKNFAIHLREKGRFPATIESYCRDAKAFLDFMERSGLSMSLLEPASLVDFQSHLSGISDEKENSIRRKVIGVRQFFRFLAEKGEISSSPFDDVPIPERIERLPWELSPPQIAKMLDCCNSGSTKDCRDRAIISLLAFEGLKANELIALKWSDFLPGKSAATLKVRGLRSRTLEIDPESERHLSQYQACYLRLGISKNSGEDNMFIAFKGKDGALVIPRMTRHGLKFMLYEVGDKVGVKKLNTELLRHHAVNHLLAQGRTPEWIMNHLGLRRLGNIAKHMSQRHIQHTVDHNAN